MHDLPDQFADRLPCGAPVAALVDQADAGQSGAADAHQARCPHCQAALRPDATLDEALGHLRSTAGREPAGLTGRVMREVRRTRPEAVTFELGPTDRHRNRPHPVRGTVRVRQQVIADVARVAACDVRGVTVVRSCAAARPGRADGPDVVLALGVVVDGSIPLPELAVAVRRTVRAAVRRTLGTADCQVDLTFLDLLPN